MFGQSMGKMARQKMSNMGQDTGEGEITKTVEHATANVPSILFLIAAGASILGAVGLRATGRKDDAQFVGQWAPTLLILGLYNKVVKTTGHE